MKSALPPKLWDTLPGWLATDKDDPRQWVDGNHLDVLLLQSYARVVPEGTAIVEIGSYGGRSAFAMLEGLRSIGREDIVIHCYDPYAAGTESDRLGGLDIRDVRDVFLEAIAKHADGQIVLHEVDSIEGGKSWGGPPVWLMHIDGDHTYNHVREELVAWSPRLLSVPMLIFDDWLSYGGIRRACWEVLPPEHFACINRGFSRYAVTKVG